MARLTDTHAIASALRERTDVFYEFVCDLAGSPTQPNRSVLGRIEEVLQTWLDHDGLMDCERVMRCVSLDASQTLLAYLYNAERSIEAFQLLAYCGARLGNSAFVQRLPGEGFIPEMALRGAIAGGDVAIVRLLLDRGAGTHLGIGNGANVAARNRAASANESSAHGAREAIVNLLLERGANPSKLLGAVAFEGHDAMVRLLLDKGAKLKKGIDGAARGGHEALVRVLLERDAHASDDEAIVRLLLARGADKNWGVCVAVRGGHENIVRLLRERGADPRMEIEMRVLLSHPEEVPKTSEEILTKRMRSEEDAE